MKILVAGGTGFIGSALVDHLASLGHQCLVLTRTPASLRSERPRVSYLGFRELSTVKSADAVINLAGEGVVGRWTPAKKARIVKSRIETTRELVQWMGWVSTSPAVFLSASAIGIYGHRPGEVLDENSSPDPNHRFRFRVCRDWESEALHAQELGTRTVLLRIGNVLDAGGGFLGTMLPWLRRLPLFSRVAPETVMSWIALPDAIRLITFTLENSAIDGPINVVGPQPVPLGDFVQLLGERLHKPVIGRIPDPLLRMFFGEFSETFLTSQDIRPAKALAQGFEFDYPNLSTFLQTLRAKHVS